MAANLKICTHTVGFIPLACTCGHSISSIFCSTPLAWLACLTFDVCLLVSSEGRPLFLWMWVPGTAAVGLEGSELGGVDGGGVEP